jgi:hypothetical protein
VTATHTGSGNSRHEERIECYDATIVYKTGHEYQILNGAGEIVERGDTSGGVLVADNLRAYFAYLNGTLSRR